MTTPLAVWALNSHFNFFIVYLDCYLLSDVIVDLRFEWWWTVVFWTRVFLILLHRGSSWRNRFSCLGSCRLYDCCLTTTSYPPLSLDFSVWSRLPFEDIINNICVCMVLTLGLLDYVPLKKEAPMPVLDPPRHSVLQAMINIVIGLCQSNGYTYS